MIKIKTKKYKDKYKKIKISLKSKIKLDKVGLEQLKSLNQVLKNLFQHKFLKKLMLITY